jgi:hypothetical protein
MWAIKKGIGGHYMHRTSQLDVAQETLKNAAMSGTNSDCSTVAQNTVETASFKISTIYGKEQPR